MRVLILSAFLAYAAAAPQFVLHPTLGMVPAFAIAPTVPPGDVEAAVINAQVRSIDQVQAVVDQARELAGQAAEKVDEGVDEANDLAKEKADQALWEMEEKKWQDLNAEQLLIAQQQAEAASTDAFEPEAKAAEPAKEPIAVEAKAEEKVSEVKAEEKVGEVKAEEKVSEVKAAEIPAEEKPTEMTAVEEIKPLEKSAEVKTADLAVEIKPSEEIKDVKLDILKHVIYTAPGVALGYQPWLSPIAYSQPNLDAYSAVASLQQLQGQILSAIPVGIRK